MSQWECARGTPSGFRAASGRAARAAIVAIGLVPISISAYAQSPGAPVAGARVRVTLHPRMGGDQLMGEFVGRRGDTLRLRPHTLTDTVAVRIPDVTRLEVARGTKRPWMSGLRIGGLTGLALGVIAAAITVENRTDCDAAGVGILCGSEKYWAMLEWGGVGAIAGSAVGVGVASRLRVGRWERVHLSPAR